MDSLENEARLEIATKCRNVIHEAKATCGEMIHRACFEHGDNYEELFNDVLSIVRAYTLEMSKLS